MCSATTGRPSRCSTPTQTHAPALKPAEAAPVGLGAQVLRSLGIQRIKVLTNHPRKIVGLAGFGIETVGALAFEDCEDA